MPKLIFKEFIRIYKDNPEQALCLVSDEDNDVDFIISAEEFILLGTIRSEEIGEFASCVRTEREAGNRTRKITNMQRVIEKLAERLSDKIADFFCDDFVQFLRISSVSGIIARKIYDRQPEKLYALVKTTQNFIQLGEANHDIAKKFLQQDQENETHRISVFFARYEQFMELCGRAYLLAQEVFNSDPARIGRLFSNCAEFFELYNEAYTLARKVFDNEPTRIGSFFTTCALFFELYNKDYTLARKVFNNEPARIGSLFTNCEQFLNLYSLDATIATTIFEKELPRMAAIFASYDQFMRLALIENSRLAKKLFEHDNSRIAALFNTEEKLERLSIIDSSLATNLRPFCTFTGSRRNYTAPQPPRSRTPTFFSHPHEDMDEAFNTPLLHSQKDQDSNRSDNYFALQCFAMLTVGGVALLLIGNLVLLPDVAFVGAVMTGAGIYGMYHSLNQPQTEDSRTAFYDF